MAELVDISKPPFKKSFTVAELSCWLEENDIPSDITSVFEGISMFLYFPTAFCSHLFIMIN